ncbi:MAG TPA: hypothetical protein PKH05_19290 [Nitrospira sp.]|nr:hypothetical protein [Nitrospira sp.]
MVTTLEKAEQFRQQTELVRTMAAKLRALLAGHVNRAEIREWTREVWPLGSGQGNPFKWGEAASIFDSVYNIDEEHNDCPLVRDREIRAYLRWLTEGETFHADEEPLAILAHDIEKFAAAVGGDAIRWWLDGVGWCVEVRFCAPAIGRVFLAHSRLDRSNELSISKLSRDDWHVAIMDLFEALAIDDKDCTAISPKVELPRLPLWAVRRQDDNGNNFEIDRHRSYTKACAQAERLTARGHKQLYWIDTV